MVADRRKVMKLGRPDSLLTSGRIGSRWPSTGPIVRALADRDAAAAMACMQAHFRNGPEAAA